MKSKKLMKRIAAVVLAAVFTACTMAGCSLFEKEEETTTATTTTTTTTTTATTTEDTETTFKETPTRKIYEGLKKDESGSYSHKVASYTTYYNSSDKERTENLKNAVDKIDNIVVPDGNTFSFNQTVGKRTITAGYKTAKVVKDGEFVDGLGGGVCQISSTLFECVLRANLKIVARSCHTLKIGYVPLGGDATVQWNSKDFQFKNNSGSDIRIQFKCSGGKLECSVYSKDKIDLGDVKIKITKSGDDYVLTRTVDGKQNYRTRSHYQAAKTD